MIPMRRQVAGAIRRVGVRKTRLGDLSRIARTVQPAAAFVIRDTITSGGVCAYRLRSSGLQVAIRHHTGDVETLGEVFHHRFYEPSSNVNVALQHVTKVVDLGANIGLFGVFAAFRWPDAEILAFEPDPANADVHEQTMAINALGERWKIIRAAAGPRNGCAAFVPNRIANSHLATAGESACTVDVPVHDVLPHLAVADLVKMDIEGGEWAIVGDSRFRTNPPRVLVLEYHSRFCPTGDPRSSAEAAARAAGLSVQSMFYHRDRGYGMLWAWRG
jgi:FkbM family methyltransferase